jgi:hypothetical protein
MEQNMERFNNLVNDFLNPITQNKYFLPVLSLTLGMYAALARPRTPAFIYRLFQNPIFRVIVIAYIIYRSNKDISTAIMVSVAFLATMNMINRGSVNFLSENFSELTNNVTVNDDDETDFNEYFSNDLPMPDEPMLNIYNLEQNEILLNEDFTNEDLPIPTEPASYINQFDDEYPYLNNENFSNNENSGEFRYPGTSMSEQNAYQGFANDDDEEERFTNNENSGEFRYPGTSMSEQNAYQGFANDDDEEERFANDDDEEQQLPGAADLSGSYASF